MAFIGNETQTTNVENKTRISSDSNDGSYAGANIGGDLVVESESAWDLGRLAIEQVSKTNAESKDAFTKALEVVDRNAQSIASGGGVVKYALIAIAVVFGVKAWRS